MGGLILLQVLSEGLYPLTCSDICCRIKKKSNPLQSRLCFIKRYKQPFFPCAFGKKKMFVNKPKVEKSPEFSFSSMCLRYYWWCVGHKGQCEYKSFPFQSNNSYWTQKLNAPCFGKKGDLVTQLSGEYLNSVIGPRARRKNAYVV